MSSRVETLEFQAEARALLRLMVHSIYSDKDVFLRELISNASDALDKLRIAALVDQSLREDAEDPHIDIEVDRDSRTLTIRDNGIGMSREDVVGLIGTIARSGTAELLRKLRESADAAASADLIGQFGVGFYATFMVADTVTLVTRKAGEPGGTRWESSGEGTYVIKDVDDVPHGTAVTVHLKPEDAEDRLFDYTDEYKIREIVKKYSDFIAWPIRMAVERPAPATAGEETDGADGGASGDGADTAAGAAATVTEIETLNSMKALWARPRDEVEAAEYNELYRHLSHDWTDPLEVIQMKGEGTFEYEALLFIPSRAPLDLYTRDAKRGVQLYVKRVFIMADCEALLPNYLRFVKGVVDARDLSLNISREILQQDRRIQQVRRRLVRKVLAAVANLRENEPEKYRTFWTEFGAAVKEGLLEDTENEKAILDIVSVASTRDPEQTTTLREYVERMKDGQTEIYYLTGDSRATIENSPHMEAFAARGYEVLILTDPVDEVWVERVGRVDDHPLKSIAKGQVDLDSDDERKDAEAERDEQRKEFAELLTWMTERLKDEVKEVRLSSRLTTSPACVVGDTFDMTPALEKMYRAMGQNVPHQRRILEVNPTHPLVAGLRRTHEQDAGSTALAETVELLYDMALLAEGGDLRDPSRFTRVLAGRLASTL
ncbi:Chaperone protein HtpG [Frankia canadensis]|uniref:Chaperone protein HtpG n=1 Tax=Frankia canadensis TaxID=1836972 RepID=A0A2I2L2T6_9ACTN|nr:molecular chaperone HtpG [Frankia canadensis]SNQ52240.1 Chaperone protein HtpG [Frankia canadensis]SOU59530.1 Chaperone protein HtpG [Frankia canadensis]